MQSRFNTNSVHVNILFYSVFVYKMYPQHILIHTNNYTIYTSTSDEKKINVIYVDIRMELITVLYFIFLKKYITECKEINI